MCLENRLPATAREFESHTLRHFFWVRMTVLTLFRLCLSWQVQNEHFAQPDTDIQADRNQKSVCLFYCGRRKQICCRKNGQTARKPGGSGGKKKSWQVQNMSCRRRAAHAIFFVRWRSLRRFSKKSKESSVHKIFTFFPASVLTFEDRRRLVFLI